MSSILYTAPDCRRCKIVKAFLADRGMAYAAVDFKADADEFNRFYRENRTSIYRNAEGVEFPLFQEGDVIRQGSGEVLAWLLARGGLEGCVTRSDLLHGRISGLYPSQCPPEQEENFLTLVRRLAAGGLDVWLQTDGRNPALLEKLLAISGTHAMVNITGGARTAAAVYGGAPTREELAKTIELVSGTPDGVIRFLAMPVPAGGGWAWASREDAEAGARMVAEACGRPTLPFGIAAATADTPGGLHGLEPLPGQELLAYRAAIRRHLFKADISK